MKKLLILILLFTLTGCYGSELPTHDLEVKLDGTIEETYKDINLSVDKIEDLELRIEVLELDRITQEGLIRESIKTENIENVIRNMFMDEEFITNEDWEELILEIIEEHDLIDESFEALEDILAEMYFQAFKDAVDEALLENEVTGGN